MSLFKKVFSKLFVAITNTLSPLTVKFSQTYIDYISSSLNSNKRESVNKFLLIAATNTKEFSKFPP